MLDGLHDPLLQAGGTHHPRIAYRLLPRSVLWAQLLLGKYGM
jgi:hypothetical protein